MTKSEINAFRGILEKKQAELSGRNRSRGALKIEPSSDELDRIQDIQERDLAIGALDRNSTLLREVREALLRIDTGKFGICADCEEDIGPKRLAALPWAAACVICQEATDREQGTPWSEHEALHDISHDTSQVMAA